MVLIGADRATSLGDVGKSASSLHARLKANTAVLHHQVEKTFDLKHRVATVAGHQQALATLRGIHCAVQQSLDQLASRGVVVDRGQSSARIGWLDQDLAGLGPKMRSPPGPVLTLRTADEALGCLYVVEGAALGGQHIYQIVQRRFGFDEHSGARYFFGFGDRTIDAWTAFVRRLDIHPAAAAGGVEDGARLAFKLFDTGPNMAEPVSARGEYQRNPRFGG